MADITWTDVEAVAPELASGVPADGQTMILAHVNGSLAADVLGGEGSARYKLARCYLAAHFGTLAKRGDAAGPVVGKSGGGLSKQYAASSPLGTDPDLSKTSYGLAYRRLVRGAPKARGPMVI